MLEKTDLKKMTSKEEMKQQLKELKPALAALPQPVKQQKLPVIILFEGWGAAGKGSMISNLIVNFDPRGYQVHSIVAPNDQEKREPAMWRHWLNIPEQGVMSVLDRSWYQDASVSRLERGLDDEAALRRMDDINIFERQLTDDGYLILKFFLHISQIEQKERFERLSKSKSTAWRVTETDWKRNRHYDKLYRAFDEMLDYTNNDCAPWHVVSGMDKNSATLEVYRTVLDSIRAALKARAEKKETKEPHSSVILPGNFNFVQMPKLADVPLDQTMSDEKYKKQLDKLQTRLSELHGKLYSKKVPVIIAYEGWDAAGKGGTICRVSEALDPRGCEVVPVAAPSREELARHYLWRFWRKLPKDGHVAIFDRTWYGRVMVERVEGFCSPEDWQRAYREINEFERQLTDWGAVVIKFWLQIDKEEQLKRFTDRQNTPAKQWKITAEDWRNRDKWDLYEPAINDMLAYTSTDYAPWHIIESQNKKYGRIQALKIITDAIENKLKQI
jgi:AMP-polyphosphate phosphotransferase